MGLLKLKNTVLERQKTLWKEESLNILFGHRKSYFKLEIRNFIPNIYMVEIFIAYRINIK